MDMKREIKGEKHKKEYGPKCIREKDIKKKRNITMSLCRDDRKYSVNDISNVRCHGWNVGSVRNEE